MKRGNSDPSLSQYPFQMKPSYSFGRAPKKPELTLLLPQVSDGPAMYQIPPFSPFTTLRFDKYSSRKLTYTVMEGPGPTAYTLPNAKAKTLAVFNRDTSFTKRTSPSPGPGDYNIAPHKPIPGGKMTKSQRKPFVQSITPGVGAYDVSSSSSKGFETATPKQKNKRQTFAISTPGPANYTVHGSFVSNGPIISTSKRKWDYLGSGFTSLVPGPGSYRLPTLEPKLTPKDIKPVIPRLSRPPEKKEIWKKFKTEGSTQSKVYLQGKIPVNFPVSRRNNDFLDIFGKSQYSDRSPGPAKYEIKQKQKSGYKFSQSKRQEINQITESPGVGHYSTVTVFGKIFKRKEQKVKEKSFNLRDINLQENQ